MQLDAAEFIRRAERGLGVAIRDGQANGTVETRFDAASRAAVERDIKLGRSTKSSEDFVEKARVADLLSKTEQTGGKDPGHSVFAMTDNVSDDQFEEASGPWVAMAHGSSSAPSIRSRARSRHSRTPPTSCGSGLQI